MEIYYSSMVLLNENLKWNGYLNTIENKLSKNIGILFKAKGIINTKGLRSLYSSFIHKFLNYVNLSWGSTHETNLKKIASKQKPAIKRIDSDGREYENFQYL